MAEVIRMPLLSDTMKEGKIVQWLKQVGDEVASDDVLAEVQTDKATMEVVPYVDGTILHIGIPEGEAAAVNQIIAIIGDAGEDFQELLEDAPASNGEAPAENAPAAPVDESPVATDKPTVEKKELPADVEVVRMPLLSDTMKKGKIVSWLKEVGDAVTSDDVLAEVETDKATMEVIGYVDGTLLFQGVPAGESAEVNGVLAVVGPADVQIDEFLPSILEEGNSNQEEALGASEPSEKPKEVKVEKSTAPKAPVKTAVNEDDSRVKASPLARKMAKDKGINLNTVQGTGDGGRIIKRDIDNYKGASAGGAVSSIAPFNESTAVESFTEVPVSQMREIIAQRFGRE